MWFNPIMQALLRSPLHPLVSKNMMLMTHTGRMIGKSYMTPMNYFSIDGTLYTISTRERVWWRNLRRSAEVILRLKGQDVPARTESIEDLNEVAQALVQTFQANPRLARYMDVRIGPDGIPDPTDIDRLAKERVIVRTVLK
jgi:hypothetical protein